MAGDGSWPKYALDFPEACRVQRTTVWQGHPPAFWPVQKGQQYAALVEFQLSLDAVLWWPPDCIQTSKGFPGFAQSALNVLVGTPILSNNAAKIGQGLCAGNGWVIKKDWCTRSRSWPPFFFFFFLSFFFFLLICCPTWKYAVSANVKVVSNRPAKLTFGRF